jgi:hypothetical protein
MYAMQMIFASFAGEMVNFVAMEARATAVSVVEAITFANIVAQPINHAVPKAPVTVAYSFVIRAITSVWFVVLLVSSVVPATLLVLGKVLARTACACDC